MFTSTDWKWSNTELPDLSQIPRTNSARSRPPSPKSWNVLDGLNWLRDAASRDSSWCTKSPTTWSKSPCDTTRHCVTLNQHEGTNVSSIVPSPWSTPTSTHLSHALSPIGMTSTMTQWQQPPSTPSKNAYLNQNSKFTFFFFNHRENLFLGITYVRQFVDFLCM